MLSVMALYGLVVAGCASMPRVTPYPTDWPERSQVIGCQIAGAYQDLGEMHAITIPSQRVAHLSSLLREGLLGSGNDSSNATVHVWLDRAVTKMRVGSDSSIQPEPLRPNGGVVCDSDGALTLQFDSDIGSAYWHGDVSVWSAADGSLIVRLDARIKEKGLPFVPASIQVFWSRFERAQQ
jgi:hypothetical protein